MAVERSGGTVEKVDRATFGEGVQIAISSPKMKYFVTISAANPDQMMRDLAGEFDLRLVSTGEGALGNAGELTDLIIRIENGGLMATLEGQTDVPNQLASWVPWRSP